MKNAYAYGIIYPILREHATRILCEGKSVFVKYPPHEVISERLANCRKLLLYVSGGSRHIAGEADIDRIELLTKEEVLERYTHELFLNREELNSYSGSRTKRLLTFTLKRPRKYDPEVQLDHYVTMVGEYIGPSEYQGLPR